MADLDYSAIVGKPVPENAMLGYPTVCSSSTTYNVPINSSSNLVSIIKLQNTVSSNHSE